ncbi:hypothetical protein EH802P2_00058 [Enterococcus phage EH802P2]|nr:head-tail connector family protein [Enterococcus phage 9181]WAX15820.1 hypothetical protein EH93P1_00052 [Enterococcus phage EH93P1]WAX15892.1 hypothetical protein EH93P2_00010 [Enterococcus phage EH93P2]WAX16037.1 hypothetical protein EH802P1_00041 [Enterococcus phage EH802P1]WAX16163.1 hypothetical protein EH802P2_00058 [Enterococcus phage EH802P2]
MDFPVSNTPLPEKYKDVNIDELKIIQGYGSISLRDDLLKLLKGRAMQHICIYIKKPFSVASFPQALEYIADELAASRLSLVNSEGIKTEVTDISRFDYSEDIYANWYKVLDDWVAQENGSTKRFFMM